MRKVRSWLVTLLMAAVVIRVLWWSVEPLIPYLIGALALVTGIGFVYYRITRW